MSAVTSRIQKDSPQRPPRRSARLHSILSLENIGPIEQSQAEERPSLCPGPRTSTEQGVKPSQGTAYTPQTRGKKRAREDSDSEDRKRHRTSTNTLAAEEDSNPIDYWRRSGYRWPQGDWAKSPMADNPAVSYFLARKKSTSSLRRKRLDSELPAEGSNTPSDQKSREAKSAPYRDPRYTVLLATKGSFIDDHDLSVVESSKKLVRKLLNQDQEQPVPVDSLFRDEIFEATCRKLRDRNETRVIRDISLLIVPSAEILTTCGASELACLIESVNEGWNNSIPLTGTRPQPDYAVGFRREAFTEEQLAKLQPFVGELTEQSFFMATYYLYFPFLTCEVKCGAAALDVADRQNAHSMTLAVRAVVELFRLVGRENELDREILAFSISHDHDIVRIYGHYPVIEAKTTFYRYPIHKFSLTVLEGKDKWTAYKFTKSVYRTWMPTHFKRLCSVIDALPADLNFELPQQSELRFSEQTRLSQDLSALSAQEDDSQLQPLDPIETPNTSFTKGSAQGGSRKAKRGRR